MSRSNNQFSLSRPAAGSQVSSLARSALLTAIVVLLPVLACAQNQPPVANAGGDRSMFTGDCITLNGTAYDPDGEQIIRRLWVVDSSPLGSVWTLGGAATSSATFCAQTQGQYLVSFFVADASGASAPDTIVVNVADNLPPVAVATAVPTAIAVGGTVCFDGSQSYDPEAGPLAYLWVFVDGSPYLFGTNRACHTFTMTGTYNVLLGVTDERNAFETDVVSITVLPLAVLRVAPTSTNTVVITWPAASPGYGLQQNADLATTNWTTVTNLPIVVADEKQVILSPAAAQNFYRLRYP
jgi:PKD repeat protein